MHSEEHHEALRRRLIAMSRDGQLASNRDGTYLPIDEIETLVGTVIGHRDGFGFVAPEEGGNDLSLSPNQMRKVFDGDRVRVRDMGLDRRGKREAVIIEVLERNTHEIVGRLFHQGGQFFVSSENRRHPTDILIPEDAIGGAITGQLVSVEITQQPDRQRLPVGKIKEILGEHLDPGMEIEVAIRAHKIPYLWPEAVHHETQAIADEVEETDKKHRVDLRALPFVTIDGEDARDFDDAVLCVPNKRTGGWRLYVAIADVSHYVAVESALDKEAFVRGNSVYFPGQVVPMLPEKLSNGLCSLNPKVDRLVMVCEMTISSQGRMSGFQFYEGIIHSHARLTYTQVGQMLQERNTPEGKAQRKAFKKLLDPLEHLYKLYKVLRKAREQRGAMDFDTVETQILFDADRKIQSIVPRERNDAHKLIEECMLSANVAAARFLEKHEIPALYRVHEGPPKERLENLKTFLGELGLSIDGGSKPSPKDYNHLLHRIEGRPDAHIIQTVLLRSLSQAHYQPDNQGHFGLNYTAYAHFTSPIRRYPDLLVHRAIRSVIRGRKADAKHIQKVSGAKAIAKKHIYPYDMAAVLAMGEHCSVTERRADEATRDVVSFLKCEYISDHVGETYPGVISAVTGFGIFVELKDLYVEGLVHVSSLHGDFYQFDPIRHQLVGERSGRVFTLGDEVVIRVARVNLDDRKVDFELTEGGMNRRQRRKTSARKASKKTAPNRNAKGKKAGSNSKTEKSRAGKKKGPSRPSAKRSKTSGSSSSKTANTAPKQGKKKPKSKPKKKR